MRANLALPTLQRSVIALSLLAGAVVLSACGSIIAQAPLIGEPPEAQNRPTVRPDFPPILAKPSERENKPMTAAERDKLQAELVAAREKAADEKREQINRPNKQ